LKSWLVIITTKIFIKLIVFFERFYTFTLRGLESDPTKLLSETFPAVDIFNQPNLINPAEAKIGVIVPFRDRWEMTLSCLKSLESQYVEKDVTLNLYLVNNGSSSLKTAEGLREYLDCVHPGYMTSIKVIDLDIPFNFSTLCNEAANVAAKDGCTQLLLLNNDIEFEGQSTIQRLVNTLMRLENSGRKVGAVGCTLLYPNRKVQHFYVAPGVKIIAAHPGKGVAFNPKCIWQQVARKVPAVTGALLLTPAQAWFAVGGLDENLPSSGQDVDYCLKLFRQGYEIFVPGQVYAIHKEGVSRGQEILRRDVQYMYDRWPELWRGGHPKLSFWSEKPCLKLMNMRFPWPNLLNS